MPKCPKCGVELRDRDLGAKVSGDVEIDDSCDLFVQAGATIIIECHNCSWWRELPPLDVASDQLDIHTALKWGDCLNELAELRIKVAELESKTRAH